MSEHPFYYSMVVDWPPTHPYQADTLLFTLEKFGEAPRDRIILQCTDRVSKQVRNEFGKNGYTVAPISPYLDGKYCNKIKQLDYFVNRDPADACGVFLLDLDMVILSPVQMSERDHVCGKIVDDTNPPLPILERIFAEAAIDGPGIVPCDWRTGNTFATNFNGGFLYVPWRLMPRVRAAWRKWAEFLYARPELFDRPHQRNNTDQISFGMALAAEKISHRHLIANWNFPVHIARQTQSFRPDLPVRVLHYHRCLDSFGLIDPVFKDGAVIDEAVRRVNAAIGTRDESLFFDLYKHHLAREVVKGIPVVEHPSLLQGLAARARIGNKRRRLILHAGSPKTGTTSLQWHLGSHRQHLAERGFWYPPPAEYTNEPKHQQLVDTLRRGDEAGFREYIEDALRDMPGDAHTIFFTAEGIFNHWWDYSSKAKGLLRALADLFDFELCVWFREPESFAAALYVQSIRNGRTEDRMKNVNGQDIDCIDALQDEWFRRHLDYLGFYYETQHLFGAERVKAFLFAGNTVQAFMEHYGLEFLSADQQRENVTLRAPAIHILRTLNRVALKQPERRQIVALVQKIDRILGERGETFRPNEQARTLVAQYARRSWEVLQRKAIRPS